MVNLGSAAPADNSTTEIQRSRARGDDPRRRSCLERSLRIGQPRAAKALLLREGQYGVINPYRLPLLKRASDILATRQQNDDQKT
jgi:hypothetical protein